MAEATEVTVTDSGFVVDWGDEDDDGVANCDDNCPELGNGDQADLDGDDLGDACDADADGDSTDDASDNCPGLYNPFQEDNDGDSLGDDCDSDRDGDGTDNDLDGCPDIYEFIAVDADGDGHNTSCDNCPNTPNADQQDSDRDGLGDACDDDDDDDGVKDEEDNCDTVYNPDQADRDDNGIGVACDEAEQTAELHGFIDALREYFWKYAVILPPERDFPPDWGCLDCKVDPYVYEAFERALPPAEKYVSITMDEGKQLVKDKTGALSVTAEGVDAFLTDELELDADELALRYKLVGIAM